MVFVHDGLDKPLPWLCPGSQRYEFRKSCYSNISLANVLSKRELCINQKLSDWLLSVKTNFVSTLICYSLFFSSFSNSLSLSDSFISCVTYACLSFMPSCMHTVHSYLQTPANLYTHARGHTHKRETTHTHTNKCPRAQLLPRLQRGAFTRFVDHLYRVLFFFNGSIALIATCHHGNNHPWRAIWLRRWRKCSHSLKRDLTRWMAQTMERCGCLTVACRYQDLLPVTTLSPRRVQFLTALCTSVSNTIWQYLDEYSPSIFEIHARDDCRPQKGR